MQIIRCNHNKLVQIQVYFNALEIHISLALILIVIRPKGTLFRKLPTKFILNLKYIVLSYPITFIRVRERPTSWYLTSWFVTRTLTDFLKKQEIIIYNTVLITYFFMI